MPARFSEAIDSRHVTDGARISPWPLLALWLGPAIAWALVRPWVEPHDLLALALKAALWLVPAALWAWRARGERPADAFAIRAPARQGLLRASAVGAVWLGLAAGVTLAAGGTLAPPRPAELALRTAHATVEEAAFRGFLLPHLARGRRFSAANAVVAALFAAVHVPTFAAHASAPIEVAVSCAYIFALGLVLGYATHVTRSIAIGVLVHTLNNLLATP